MKALYYKTKDGWVIVEVSHNASKLHTKAADYLAKGVAVKVIPYLGGCLK